MSSPLIDATSLLVSIPVIDDTSDVTEANCDWPSGTYQARAVAQGSRWLVQHDLTGAPGIEELLATDQASYAVEVHCPRTMVTKTAVAAPPGDRTGNVTLVELGPDDTFGAIWLHPGVVTVRDCALKVTGTGWVTDGATTVPVPAGRWLVRGAPSRVVPEAYDPIRLQSNPDMEPAHRVRIRPVTTPDVHFVVEARPDRIERIKAGRDPVWLFCWATALAQFPHLEECKIVYADDGTARVPNSAMADGVLRLLESDNVDHLWDDDDWDPVAAASVTLRLHPYRPDDDADA